MIIFHKQGPALSSVLFNLSDVILLFIIYFVKCHSYCNIDVVMKGWILDTLIVNFEDFHVVQNMH